MNNLPFIPFHAPTLGQEEIDEVVATLKSGWLTTGPRTHRFETEFREYTGARHALGLNSCTAGLHLALAALGIGPGDEVITPAVTFCAAVNSIIHVGATPVLADIGEDGNLCPAAAAERITPRTRAIIPVHYGGLPCDMDALWTLARKHGLKVIEDAAHAAGTHYGADHLGAEHSSQSDAVAYSFYANKNMTTGEGGMITTNNSELMDIMRRLALHGINKDAWNRYAEKGKWLYSVQEPGFKYNLSDLQSALGIHQLHRLEGFIQRRAELAAFYDKAFLDVDEVTTPPDATNGRNAWHLYVLRLNLEHLTIARDEFVEELKARGVGASVHFIPIQLHPFYSKWAEQQPCPRSLAFFRRIVSLPLHPGLTDEQANRVADAVKDIVATYRKMPASASFLPQAAVA
jgi:dTDP-4-amino-4,6-dideoxygalactose transaminase